MTLLRSAAFNVLFYGSTLLLCVFVGLPLIAFAPTRALWLAQVWARFNLAALRLVCGVRLVVVGAEILPRSGAGLVASQHQSAFDTLVWLTLLPRCCYVLKQELTEIPLFGHLIRRSGMIAIDREARVAALRNLRQEGARAAAEHRQIVIFPEGTRAPPGERLPLQAGIAALAAATGLDVVPAATDSGRCWRRKGFRKWPGTIHIMVQPPIPKGTPRPQLLAALSAALDRGERAIAAGAAGG